MEEGGPSYKVASYSEGDSPTSKVLHVLFGAIYLTVLLAIDSSGVCLPPITPISDWDHPQA